MNDRSKREKSDNCSPVFGFFGAIIFVIIMSAFGSPYDFVHKVDLMNVIPPIWLWKTTSAVWGFLLGFSAGKIVYTVNCRGVSIDGKIYAYRGGLFFIAAFFSGLSHYPLFFNAEKLFLSLVTAILAAIFSLICGFTWSKLKTLSATIMFAYSFWLFYVAFVNLQILFRI